MIILSGTDLPTLEQLGTSLIASVTAIKELAKVCEVCYN